MSLCVIFMMLPVGIYTVLFTMQNELHPYHWSWVHSNWDVVLRFPTNGAIALWDRVCWVLSGYVVFIFFGLGRDARGMYRTWLVAAGFGRVFPSLLESGVTSSQDKSMLSSMSSKAKQFLRLKSKDSTKFGSV
jgi:pheromone a factor receptor